MSESSQFARLPILSGSKDYALWSLAIKGQAQLSNIWRVYSGAWTEPSPVAATATAEEKAEYKTDNKEWIKAEEKATGLLWRTVTQDLQLVLNEYKVITTPAAAGTPAVTRDPTARDLWELLKACFEKRDGISAVIDWGNLVNVKLVDDGSISMETQLAAITTHRSRVAVSGFTFEDWQFAALLLLALPPSFESIKSTFLDGLADPKTLNLLTVTTRISEKDNRNTAEQSAVNAIAGPSQPANKGKKPRPNVKAKERKEQKAPPGPCHNCGKEGHWNRDCKSKKKKPDQPGSSSSLHVVENDGEVATSSADANEFLLCYATSSEDWLMDSGATEHLTPYATDFKSYVAFSGSESQHVTLGDGKTRLRVLGQGTIERWVGTPESSYRQLILTNVLHVQGIKRRFLSLSTFDDKGFELHMKSKRFELSKGTLALTGHRVGKLYIAPMWQQRPLHSAVQLNSAVAPLPAKVWHERMGHLNWEALKAAKGSSDLLPLKGIALTSDVLPHSSTCPGCQAGKSKRHEHKASPTRYQRSTHPCERIHSDLVGPLPTASIFGHRYTVSFTCDYTDHVWSEPMKSKDQTLATFKRFCAQVKKQYGLSIRYFRSDRGGEFMSKDFKDFLGSEGIIHETSAPDTPQQNGLAERMQQTIWSGIRAILHHSGLKNGFWSEALAVIIHVINRAPRKRLDWRTPHEILTGQVPNVAYFRTFGCRAWVHNNKGKKLDAKALPMIFVGYEPGSKAYRLWDPRGHKIVISSDVNFDETVFPNKPEEQPVTPPTISERQDLGPQRRKKKSKGKKKAVTFVDIPEAFFLEDEERNQLLPPRAGLLGPQPRLPLPPPPAPVLPYAPAPVPANFIPPIVQIKHRTPSSAGSPPGTPSRVPQPATREATRSPSPDHHPTWRSPSLRYESSDSEEEVETRLLPSPEVTVNLSTLAQPSSTPAPMSTTHTPSSIAIDLSDHYVSPEPESQHSDSSLSPEPRRSQRIKEANLVASDDDMAALDAAYNESVELFVTATSHGEPRSYREAVDPANPDSPLWIAAVEAELKSLQDHGTWKVVPRPEGKRIVSCKWVWRIKTKPDGSVERYKARLVARGFTQTRGVDYNETFAPVTRLDTLRLLAATAAQREWEFRQIDIKTAYLYGELEEEVYMAVPEGLQGIPEGHVLLLIKALYGLKQAGCQWYFRLFEVMTEFGMKRIESNPHTFICFKFINQVKLTIIIPIWVDDLFPAGDKALVDDFETWIPKYFETSPPCDAHYFLGIRVTRNRIPESPTTVTPYICFDQISFVKNVLSVISKMFGKDITVRKTVLPAAPIVPNDLPTVSADASLVRKFQSAVGQLMYIMLATRPDLAYPVGILARHASNPSPDHITALFHLLGYLRHTAYFALVFRKPRSDELNPGLLEAYTDADWAGEEHSGRSTSGMVILKNGAPIAWSSKRQGCVSTSTMEAEYIAMFTTVQNAIWISSLEDQFGTSQYLPHIWCDNTAAIAIAIGGEMSFKKSRFMNVKYHYTRQAYEEKKITIEYIESAINIADLFTKRVAHSTLHNLRECILEHYEQIDEKDSAELDSPDSQ
jgi:hypothetical protein